VLAAWTDQSSHRALFGCVDDNVALEVLDCEIKAFAATLHNLYTGLATSEGTTHWTST